MLSLPRTRSERWGLGLLVAIALIGFTRWTKNVDFSAYLHVARDFYQSGLNRLPYPQSTARIGDYFQSPTPSLFFVPWTFLGEMGSRLAWSIFLLASLAVIASKELGRAPTFKEAFLLALLFAHPLSDVFLAGNSGNLMLLCFYAGLCFLQSDRIRFQLLGGFFCGIAVLVKLFPAYALGYFLLRKEWRRAAAFMIGLLFVLVGTAALLGDATGPLFKDWFHALSLYDQAATPDWHAFQSPPAALYRALHYAFGLNSGLALQAEKVFGLAILSITLLVSWRLTRAAALALLLAACYWSSPFAWTSQLFFTFPLAVFYLKGGIENVAWIPIVVLTLLGKDLWVESTWHQLAQWSLPAFCLISVHVLMLRRLCGPATKRTS